MPRHHLSLDGTWTFSPDARNAGQAERWYTTQGFDRQVTVPSPWQLYGLLQKFLIDDTGFPQGTFHMKDLRKSDLSDFVRRNHHATLPHRAEGVNPGPAPPRP